LGKDAIVFNTARQELSTSCRQALNTSEGVDHMTGHDLLMLGLLLFPGLALSIAIMAAFAAGG
jgi:hypothetical protein